MTTYYKATFSDGTVKTRSTAGRTYTHAYLVRNTLPEGHWSKLPEWEHTGFSGSERLAQNQVSSLRSGHRNISFAEIAPVVETTPQEYRALKA